MTWLADHALDLLGWGGSALLIYSLLQTRVLRLRTLNFVASVVLVVFNAALGVWPMVAMNAVLALINVWFIVRMLAQRHDEAAFDVIPVAPHDAFLAHVLGSHASDIARHQPGLAWDPADPAGHAFVVVKGDETVGVVLLRATGADGSTAEVLLDYVTPRYRDFSPGEFVWCRSTMLREHGFRRVVTPRDMVGSSYYARIGFDRTDDRFALDL